MTALFVVQFLTLLWAAGLSIWLAIIASQSRDTRRAVLAAFKGEPNILNLPPRPVSIVDAARITGENATPTPPRGGPLLARSAARTIW